MEQDEKDMATMMHLGKHLIEQMASELPTRFNAWEEHAADVGEEAKTKGVEINEYPSMPVEMNVVTMKVADGEVFQAIGIDEIGDKGGVPMKIEIGRPWFVEFKNGMLPREGETPEYTPKSQIPSLIKAIMSEQPSAVGFIYVAESWVWRGDLSEYVPYHVDPNAGPREEALVVTFQSVSGQTVTGVMPISKDEGRRSLKPLEFGQPFNSHSDEIN